MENNVSKQKMFVFVVFVLLLMTVFLIIANQLKKNQVPSQTNKTEVSPTIILTKTKIGRMELILKESAQPIIGQPFSLILLADSNGKKITGFDALIGYDKTALELINATALKEDFKVSSFDNIAGKTVNGARKIQYNQPVVFSNTELMELNFKPLKIGVFSVNIVDKINKETTQMVDTDNKIIYPGAFSFSVNIQQ